MVENYRSISILGSFTRIFDSIIANKLNLYIVSKISLDQPRFSAGKSAFTNLMLYSDFLSSSLSSGNQEDSVYLDSVYLT